ncbi:glyceraldehyde-3-phosphate dehydrogenase [[Clostridium] sordellii]|uniref:type I glyceraldehyde-3-phosphate dehydrogenase n=1 Tax=Paraclostridium sordellii TaxID=1505 RepID=UPI0005E2006C|nr:type I glyceraldehyde-3-phosphate dehydrogenase [Paeniclostridium sordellii]MBX9180074.1 type I glyceraldehyde-3-phosphate dehydrogenase [Paeniclostridium sordellii]CEO11020.1 glyceraldehyde-3-phosphate dehydrogenase [[Clostridium] sordellii] [Paeniclostridium sordellii]CEP84128.1 glyceraldehyde-3-phosphate dehydrogenase [[Clostridium] sordellii] [Paeniclostridium sordellii]
MKTRVAINGFGRIGRMVLRIVEENGFDNFEIVAINARSDAKTLAHLFTYDSSYGIFRGKVEVDDKDNIVINDRKIKVLKENNPENLPWNELDVDIVIESTGKFTKREDAQKHIKAGAKKVIITAPGKNEDKTIVMGVNENEYDNSIHHIISNASCTTNCIAPVVKVLDEEFGIEKGLMTTIHAYTNDQQILDKTHKDLRRARSAGVSMIPTTTGAAKAVAKVLPDLEGKLNGFAVRVPTPSVSMVDLVCELSRDVTVGEINNAFEKASQRELNGILGYSELPLVSVDYKQTSDSSIVDGLSTMVNNGNLVKVVAWYDNEWGYSCRTVDLVAYVAKELLVSNKVSA